MKQFLKRNKKTIINLLLLILVVALMSVAVAAILFAVDVIYYENGIRLNYHIFDSFINSPYGWLIVITVQVVITTVLCFMPGTTMMFLVLIQVLYDRPWQAFLISFVGVMLSSLIMYLTGRYGGRKLCEKILGERDYDKAINLLNHKGKTFFPVMMLLPMFPDDALVMIAGALELPLGWFIPSIIIGRGISVASIIFGFGSVPYEKFTTPLHWVAFISAVLVAVLGLFFVAYKFNKYLEKRK